LILLINKTKKSLLMVLTTLLCGVCNGDDGRGVSAASVDRDKTRSGAILADQSYQNPIVYSSQAEASLPLSAVTESAAVTHHQITLNNKTFSYTATAGHLTAKQPKINTPKASFFYVAYTADNRPMDTRPVTFFYNGGPGSSTIWLHLGSFGPKRLQISAPNSDVPTPYQLVDNTESLLDTTDLVFIDAIGTGYSQAIEPNTNQTFWAVDADAAAFRDFVIRYLEVNQRSASPKYLFGESYGGARSSVLANQLEMAGVKLDGVILQSPLLDFNSNCYLGGKLVDQKALTGASSVSCAGYLPTYALIGAYHGFNTPTPTDLHQYAEHARVLVRDQYMPAVNAHLATNAPPPQDLIMLLTQRTGATHKLWQSNFNLYPTLYENSYQLNLIPDTLIGRYDGRIRLPKSSPRAVEGDPAITYIVKPFDDAIKSYLPDVLKYMSASPYALRSLAIQTWDWKHDNLKMADTIPDLAAALLLNPSLKILSLNGYYDLATPFYQTELDLARLGIQPNLTIKNYLSGHMVYLDDRSRSLEKADVMAFIKAQSAAR